MNDFELNGAFTSAHIYANICDAQTISQVTNIINQPFMKDCKVAIMPDCHSGKGCVIGTTATINNKINVNMVGVDIGCGMLTVPLKEKDVDFKTLDEVIRKYVPSGASIHQNEKDFPELNNLNATIDKSRAKKSIGTLGSGNHFIEVNKDTDGNLYLVIHTGSRHLGLEIAVYHHNVAIEYCKAIPKIEKEYSYLENELLENYLNDMKIAQRFAVANRKTIAEAIINNMHLDKSCFENSFETIHNYISFEDNILRKGAVSAKAGEKLLIPINMRDGSLICIGKGNPDWNYSAPHGAGRLMSRSQAKDNISLDDFKETMNGIYSTSICKDTLDESPMAYKPMEEITDCITETVDIIKVIKPVYNFKAH